MPWPYKDAAVELGSVIGLGEEGMAGGAAAGAEAASEGNRPGPADSSERHRRGRELAVVADPHTAHFSGMLEGRRTVDAASLRQIDAEA